MGMTNPEEKIARILLDNGIEFEREKTFEDLKGKKQVKFRFDFFLTSFSYENIIIEVDGPAHWNPIYGRDKLLRHKENDRKKNSYCLDKKIKLIRIPFWEFETITFEKIFNTKEFEVKTKWHNDMVSPP